MQQQLDYVLRTVEERGVRFVRLWFTDVLGTLKSFAITPAELEGALEEGMTFDGSAIQGYSRVQESDMLALPDPCPGAARTPPSPACSATSSTCRATPSRATPATS
jgi:glutamine synthetase